MSKIASIFLAIVLVLALTRPTQSASDPPALSAAVCGTGPVQSSLISQLTTQRWADWIRQLSGETPVQVNGQTVNITSRLTPAMFWSEAPSHSAAFDFILEQVRQWYPEDQIQQQAYTISSYTARNLIVELPGRLYPNEIVVLSAHLDSYTVMTPYVTAPGAEDNGSGSAALLEAARLLRSFEFERTLQIIWFTGEEQGLYGSQYYVSHLPAGRAILGNVNLDMFGYDADNDHCFELHVGTRPASEVIGQCFMATIQTNALELTADYLTTQADGSSDHASFWSAGLGAVEVLENYSNQNLPGGCVGNDRNPHYHTPTDKIEFINLAAGSEIARAGVTTAANMAGVVGTCTTGSASPLAVARSTGEALLTWGAVAGASGYRIWRSSQGCTAGWAAVGETVSPGQPWVNALPSTNQAYVYQVQALGLEGCALSTCSPAFWPNLQFLPKVSR